MVETTSARTTAFYVVQVLSWLGMALLWFEGDQVPDMIIPYFGLHLANMFLSASFWLTESNGARNLAFRTIGSFFLLQAIEVALCTLPPHHNGVTTPQDLAKGNNRYRTAYTGAVLLLVTVFAAFGLSYTNFSAPTNAGSRIATLRGLLYLVAVATCIVSSAISWSYKPICPDVFTYGATAYTMTNAVLILTAVVILSSLFYGDGESDSLALLLATIGVITYGPVYYNQSSITTISHSKWKAHEAVVFCGLYCFILGVFLDRILHGTLPLGARIAIGIKERVNKFDILAVMLGIAGAVCTYAFNTTDQEDYRRSYGIIIPFFSLVGAITGTDSGKIIATFLGYAVLSLYDVGSGQTTTGYVRGGLMLAEAAVLVVVLSNTIRGRSIDKIVTYPAYVALAKFIVGCIMVPNGYSIYFLQALTVIAAENFDDVDYCRVSYLLLAWDGLVGNFLLTTPTIAPMQIINFASSVVFAYHYLKTDAKQAPSIAFGDDSNAPIEAVEETVKEAA